MKTRTLGLIAILAIGVLALTGCNKNNTPVENPEETAEVANPASVYCEENGGTLLPREDEEGNQYSLCAFDNGIACEEWDFYNGDCKPDNTVTNEANSDELINEEVIPEISNEEIIISDEDITEESMDEVAEPEIQ